MRKLTALLLLLLPAAAHAAITGSLVDETGKPVAGATIRVFPAEPTREARKRMISGKPEREPLSTATSKDDGTFSIDTKGTIAVDVQIEAPGGRRRSMGLTDNLDLGTLVLREPSTRTFRVTAGGKPVPNVLVAFTPNSFMRTDAAGTFVPPEGGGAATFIHPDYALDHIVFANNTEVKLQKGTAVRGRVAGADGKPVKGATLTVNGYPLAESGEDGSFTITRAPSNWSAVHAFAGADAGAAPRAGNAPLEIRLRRGAVVSGVARDSVTGNPVPGAQVMLYHSASRGEQMSVFADAKGRFTFDPMPQGSYGLSAQHWNYSPDGSSFELTSSVARNVALRPLAFVYGRVLDEARKPVAGALVSPSSAADARRTVTDGAGNFLLRLPAEQRAMRAIAMKRGYAAGSSPRWTLQPGQVVKDALITLPQGFPLQVRVVDRAQRPVAGVRLSLMARDEIMGAPAACEEPAREACTISDAKGLVTYRVVEGDYQLFARGEQTKIVSFHRQVTLNARSSPYVLEVEAGAAVSGRVVYADGTPAANAEIEVQPNTGMSRDETTDAAGAFTLESLPPTRLTLVAVTSDRRLTSAPVEVTPPARNVTITLPRGGRIEGRVTERGTGRPVTDFTIVPVRRGGGFGPPPAPQPVHAEDGAFVMENVAAGNAAISVSSPGFVSASRTDLVVEEGGTLSGVEVQLERGARVTGRVTAGGKPLAGVGVMISTGQGMGFTGIPARAVTDADGEYALDGVAAGERTFDFRKQGYVSRKKTVEVTAAKETRLDVELDRGRELRGRVVDSGGAPMAGVNVSARPSNFGSEEVRATSEADGSFTLEGLAEPRYNVTARKTGYVSATERDVDLPATAPITLTLKTGGTVTGRVTGLPERELANVYVSASAGPDGGASAQTDQTGAFTLRGVPDGQVTVSATVSGGARRSRPKTITVTNGAAPPVEIDFDDGYTLRGRVTVNGTPLQTGSVNFSPAAPSSGGTGFAFARIINGNYEASGLVAAEYRVMVMGPEVRFEEKFQVSGSGTHDIEMRGANVRGRVVDAGTGAPVAGASIGMRAKKPGAGRNTQSDSDGRFLLAAVPDDTYTLMVTAQSYGQSTKDVVVAGGTAPEVEIRLEGGKEVAVKIVDATTGKLLSNANASVNDAKGVPITGNMQRDEEGIKFYLHAGQYTLNAFAQGYVPQTKVAFSVPSGELRIALQRGGGLSFRTSEPRRVRLMAPGATKPAFQGTAQPNQFSGPQNIAPGSYVLEILGKDNSVEKSIPVTVIAGETVTVMLD